MTSEDVRQALEAAARRAERGYMLGENCDDIARDIRALIPALEASAVSSHANCDYGEGGEEGFTAGKSSAVSSPSAYGSAIRKRKSGRILDVELHSSREEAQEIVDRQNSKEDSWDLSTEWAVVAIQSEAEVSSLSDACAQCGHARKNHYENDGCYGEGCLHDNGRFQTAPHAHEFVAASTPPTITDDMRERGARAVAVPTAFDPDAFWVDEAKRERLKAEAFATADAVLTAALHPGGETNGN